MVESLGWPKVLTGGFQAFLVTLSDQNLLLQDIQDVCSYINTTLCTPSPAKYLTGVLQCNTGENHHSISTVDRLLLFFFDHMPLCTSITPLYICHVVDQSKL
jgi:hypothetical protein